ncbi:MAG TPA: SUMF1/EgtB/PvdO family nonheme iron enzyme [Bacteroidales bacterium]|jgi:formylglycine-generating enzyme required for sulfatase activity|nr:SUMF1/EgtB/PvdO family nonheme iron enzyme [Bacteroidales bacterium]HQH25404.1 SUMF1/EgtB/PvdO family nonheme iron enzyme [Bacteroidales bacterium]HQJ83174.1 SUMF1/EgtB/PvdO family nonheme iron enzyme [Bacteroidales bacterium]
MIFRKKIQRTSVSRNTKYWFFISGLVVFALLTFSYKKAIDITSTDKFCASCHVHPDADRSWKLSTHYNNKSGVVVHCVECHLPPRGQGFFLAKARTGLKDLYGYIFKDTADIDWEMKKLLEYAKKHVYESSCIECHENLYPVTLSVNGGNAHLLYETSKDPVHCLNCHLNVGHYDKHAALHAADSSFGITVTSTGPPFPEAAKVERFEDFTEMIPGTRVSFDMVALPGGKFRMGSGENEPLRNDDEGPVREVTLSPFWIGRTEVTWDEYLAFFRETSSQGRTEGQVVTTGKTDAISGATPPWGAPDQGWGKGARPAITMTWHAASVYCQWLSQVTGKKYRLPTEAEWEYACRGGTETPYFFEGNPKKFTSRGFLKKFIGPDTANIASSVVYMVNSPARTQEPSFVRPNPFGLLNMLGNVAEFCLDYYSADYYAADSVRVNPRGPARGKEHVIRGGSFRSDAKDVRSAARASTRTDAWLVTDPQMPKSIWWYSDCIDVGFRVVCEIDSLKSER